MVQISDIKTTKKGRYALFCDAEFLFSVDEETFCEFGLYKGIELDDAEFLELQERSELGKAKAKALAYVAQRDHSEHELLQKLMRAYDEPTARAAFESVKALGYLDDDQYVRDCVEFVFPQRSMSRRAAAQYLHECGIDNERIEDALAGYGESDYDRAVALIEQKYSRKLASAKGVNATFNALLRRGFSVDDIRDAIERLKPDYDEIGD